MYTVKQLADMAGVTVRTLHHYDAIGLLKPSAVGRNGYRFYEEPALYRLQQILFYRELEVPLSQIRLILNKRDFDVLAALDSHRRALQRKAIRLERLIETIDNTTKHLRGQSKMNHPQLFGGFSEEEQERLAAEAGRRWDSETVRRSNETWKKQPAETKQRILEEGNALYMDLVAAMPEGASSEKVQAIVGRWHAHLQYFWSPNDEQLLGLADLYNDDPRFRANFEAIKPGLAAFMREAIQYYVTSRK